MNIGFNEFKTLSMQGNLIPIYKEVIGDVETPVSAFLKLDKKPSFLLESVVGGEKWARYSFIGIDPSMIITSHGRETSIKHNGTILNIETNDPLIVVKDILSKFRPVNVNGLPRFYGGFVGYMGYDIVKFFERVPDIEKPGLDMPDIFLMLTDTLLIFDNLKQTIKVVCNVHTDKRDLRQTYKNAADKIDRIIDRLREGIIDIRQKANKVKYLPATQDPSSYRIAGEFPSNFTKDEFMNAVIKTKEYIKAGDIFQLVLSQRFERNTEINAFDIYRALRIINPSPYMYFLDIGDSQIVGSSPEILVRLEGDKITLRPIAGTRKRGRTEEEDKALEEDLRKDPKEMAEHIMLVDLGRNDVGRVAQIGSVKVTELMTVERYSHVMHLVSNVEGKLKEDMDAFDVFRASFPAGTVSGAPKVRAMEIIEELEPTKRGPYAGAVGYFSYSGNMDTCITIRTLIVKDKKVYVQSGAGIVADSVPEKEYMETVNKAMGMFKAVEMAENMG